MRTLVTGGVRSGKSTHAEALARQAADVVYVATSERRADDAEWVARIRAHEARRPASWDVRETLDVATVLREPGEATVLVDCIGVWLTRILDACGCWVDDVPDASLAAARARGQELVDAVAATSHRVVLVTNEVGWGVVPPTRSGRLFADELGRLNAQLAAVCDEVVLCVAGIPVTVKGA